MSRSVFVVWLAALAAACSSSEVENTTAETTSGSSASTGSTTSASASTTTGAASTSSGAAAGTMSGTTSGEAAASSTTSGSLACGNNTAAVSAAALAFLGTLSGTTLTEASLPFTLDNAETWSNLPGASRNGPQFNALTTEQQTAALALAQVAVSDGGYLTMNAIRAADDVILSTDATQASGWGSGLTHFAVLGDPDAGAPWMLQISAHHLAYDITYNAPNVSATPMFIGTEPPNWTALPDGGTLVTGIVSGSVLTFANGVSEGDVAVFDAGLGTEGHALEAQRAAVEALAVALQADTNVASAATLSGTFEDVTMGIVSSMGGMGGMTTGTTPSDTDYPFYPDSGSNATGGTTEEYPTGTTGRGVLYSALTSSEQSLVKAMIGAWVDTQASDIACNLLAVYEDPTALAQTYVAFAPGTGGTTDFEGYPNMAANPGNEQHAYIRVDGPRVWIEFVVQTAVAFRTQNWVHYHSLWRDKVADYGSEFYQ